MASKQKRGVVIGSALIRTHNIVDISTLNEPGGPRQSFTYWHRPDMAEEVIRQSLLYFDELQWPNNDWSPVIVPGLEILEQQGFLKRDTVAISRPPPGAKAVNWWELMRGVHTRQFQQLDAVEPGVWSFAPVGPEIGFWPPQNNVDHPAIKIELYNALPVPRGDVQYADVLDLKSRRHAELEQLRDRLETLYLDVVGSGDVPLAKTRALEQLDKAITDLTSVVRAARLNAVYKTLSISLLLEAGRQGLESATTLGVPAEYGAVIGVAGALYKFTKEYSAAPVSRAGPLLYLYRAAQEGVVDLPV
jgi:hypothetical protein